MRSSILTGLKILVLFALVLALSFAGSYVISKCWGTTGDIIGGLMNTVVIFAPFVCTNERNPYEENLKKTLRILLIAYVLVAAFYGIGYLGNLIFGICTKHIVTVLLGFGMVFVLDAVLFGSYLLYRKISNRNLTTK